MLNIPEDVKTLFKRDDVFKNFHVHFPNGETTDLNNDNIVSESVEFTESLCSQQSFRFGLTEASEIQFTAVGIPNVRGAAIECAIEIQVDDLGAEWLADNQPTGTEDFLDPQVCTYGSRNMYRVPYGRFIVDKCPRNHEGMWKREVTAYTWRAEDALANPFQVALINGMYPDTKTYEPNAKALFYSLIGNLNETILSSAGYTETEMSATGTGTLNLGSQAVTDTNGNRFYLQGWIYTNNYQITGNEKKLYKFSSDSAFTHEDGINKIVSALEHFSVDAVASGYNSLSEIAEAYVKRYEMERGLFPYYDPAFYYSGVPWNKTWIPITQKTAVIYPYIQTAEKTGNLQYLRIPTYVDFYKTQDHTDHGTAYFQNGKYFELTDSDPIDDTLVFDNTLTTKTYIDTVGTTTDAYSFANAFSLSDIARGYLELRCLFGSPSRTGGMEITALDNTAPVPIVPSDYASLWYDETTIAPIGYVQAKYKDSTGAEQDLTVQIGTGASVYDLRDNEMLNNMVFEVTVAEAEASITIESKIIDYLESVFIPNVPDLSFVPIEMEKKGLPYFEAGDAVTITTGDGQTVPSFILRQTIKGIQFLQADVESANGEAVELIES